ncbi:phospho-N-acetylmuramoyl-pentapeptide-transferase [Salisediminibacterium halotolerans]|uniref:Phospho-N-acetylmuramoyl-pentapeptide-transferase n=1 Tax=Salisediminibacterium halotolerans TaxID=517425 RepID=A0A1H9PUQ9_9BACI|nr:MULTISPECIES: phospho-N-acetylmuramoyl-pentapeptide-transferase [Salisediminibacterium]RLJ74308.1 phospho-N-acetylmuramoyl-pentapeptide-transferase [Actinophytocola xinjiangensis]RPE87599.1 phospho-N-acetylmuramoyl-pentapeptide-transferase [Salisediminibacterium halotolerans]TWG35145.1 phospho-N-acetylmuramoyl-pentapeptide-transferase [Salisediminibacterium halotolerans]SER51951.1 phospho-N-acetylmuramoyl-pentapeptide-transferase [Salisediminibacterium haloalkalitolerans]GEL07296.1 phospho-
MLEHGIIYALLAAFAVSAGISPIVIPFLRKLKFGQSIRDEGPKSHMKKTGTPTMGGLMIIGAIAVSVVVVGLAYGAFGVEIALLLLVTLGFGLLGFLDDYIKVVKKRNLGLTSKQKFLGQVGISVIVYFTLLQTGISTDIRLPGTEAAVEIGWLYLPLIIIMLVGTSNAVNLTDGLDGLVAGSSVFAFGAFSWIAYSFGETEVALFAAAVVGASLGFLIFNINPAKVFMGDTGSLALGGALAMIAILAKAEIVLVLIGGVFVIETLSVMIQVASYKTRKKRVFKMSPLHHHFELSGWGEWRVVTAFWLAGFVLAAAGTILEVVII